MAIAGSLDFKSSFREEARELVADLEACLLELNEDRESSELIGRAFRALHTIKGSGAMFGFDVLASFTHDLENAFDEVRRGRMQVTPELVDLTLTALDRIRSLVEQDPEKGEPAPEGCEEILQAVQRLTGATVQIPGKTGGAPAESEARAPEKVPETAGSGERQSWHIRFAPGPELMRNGTDPLLLLRELRQLGDLQAKALTTDLPPLAQIEPDRCYIRWEMTLTTAAGVDAIRDVFIFVEDCCELEIVPAEAELASAKAAAPAAAEAGGGNRRSNTGRRWYDKPDNAASLRVAAAKLDQLVDLVGELVTVQARLSEVASRSEDAEVAVVSEEIERLTSALRENSMNLRMLPIRATFERFRRLVHDLARELGKDVELTIQGAETELDKTVIDQLSDPLMHLIRNSMDHGIESPERRLAAGKKPVATIHLAARQSGANVLISVSDDGGGIDTDAVRCRAVERGLIAADTVLSQTETFALLFQPGFSTAREVTDISGRGVGMDVVRQKVEGLRGSIEVASGRGEGTTVTLRLPLTLAIIDGLLVAVGNACFVLPLASTLECIELTHRDVEQAGGRHVINVRGDIVPYIRLRQYFGLGMPGLEREQIMIVESEQGRCGLVVDQVLGDCQTVIRSLGRLYRHVQVVSGATILGNGTVALILDPHRLVQEAIRARGQPARGFPCASAAGEGGPSGTDGQISGAGEKLPASL